MRRRAFARGIARQERCQVDLCADRTHARATATVRYAEGLMQIEMTDVGADEGFKIDRTAIFHVVVGPTRH